MQHQRISTLALEGEVPEFWREDLRSLTRHKHQQHPHLNQ